MADDAQQEATSTMGAVASGSTVAPGVSQTSGLKTDAFWDTCFEWPRLQSQVIRAEDREDRAARHFCCCCRLKTGLPPQVPDKGDRKFQELFDTDSPEFLDAVSCECLIKVTAVDPKASSYELRMKCKWAFRTLDTHDRMETKMRVPGIRLPGLIVEVNESRVWKDLQKTKESKSTVFWRGVSLFTITGFERFEMHDFPYDRQLMMMEMFEFVWRANKDAHDFVFSMHIASLRVQCISMLPEWDIYPAVVQALNPTRNQSFRQDSSSDDDPPPEYASRFSVKLRVQRANWFYIVQIFGLTILITLASLMPLLLPAGPAFIGNRLGLYSGGILTLTATKYSISDQLPSVPYSTKFDRVMFMQFFCVFACAVEAVIIHRYVQKEDAVEFDSNMGMVGSMTVRWFETWLWLALSVAWIATWLHLAADHLSLPYGFQFKTWSFILRHQEDQGHADESEMFEVGKGRKEELENQEKLQKLNDEIARELVRQGTNVEHMIKTRETLEAHIAKSAEKRKAQSPEKKHDD